MPKITSPRPAGKPKPPRKPYKTFPLFSHQNGQWCKKIKGKHRFFGVWADPDAAQRLYDRQKDAISNGEAHQSLPGDATIADACNHFLTHKTQLCESGELAERTFDRYKSACEMLVDYFGRTYLLDRLNAGDFTALRASMAKRWGPVALGNEIQMVRSVFRFGYESQLIDRPVRFGPGFRKPSAKTLRIARTANGPKLFTPEQLQALLKVATVNLRAMLLLGLNGGMGNTDIAELPIKALDLDGGWLDYARTKTGIMRRIPLWPETVEAIRGAMKARKQPEAADDAPLLFVGPRGKSYIGNHRGYRVTAEFNRGAAKAKIEGRTFYDLRRTFQTVAEGARDLVAVQHVMGHAPGGSDMSAIYRQSIEDERLEAVSEHVRKWLFAKPKAVKKPKAK
jgi:integrase